MSGRWVRVAPAAMIPPREGRSVVIGGVEIALFNLGEEFFATDNQCPHKGGPLCDGILAGRTVVCPLHGWKINLDDGTIARPAGVECAGVRTYSVRIEDGVVAVLVAPERNRRVTSEPDTAEKIQNCLHIEA